jgi:hypothetical protein
LFLNRTVGVRRSQFLIITQVPVITYLVCQRWIKVSKRRVERYLSWRRVGSSIIAAAHFKATGRTAAEHAKKNWQAGTALSAADQPVLIGDDCLS